jgi:hypothetical protein
MKKAFSAQFQHQLEKDDSIVLTINTKGAVPNCPRTRIWHRDRNGVYLQLGLITDLKIVLDSDKYLAKVEASMPLPSKNNTFSPLLKKILVKNAKILTKHGIEVKSRRIEPRTYDSTGMALRKSKTNKKRGAI